MEAKTLTQRRQGAKEKVRECTRLIYTAQSIADAGGRFPLVKMKSV
jgi:hypothetical protein